MKICDTSRQGKKCDLSKSISRNDKRRDGKLKSRTRTLKTTSNDEQRQLIANERTLTEGEREKARSAGIERHWQE